MSYVTSTPKLCDCGAVAVAIQQDKLYCAKCWMTNFAHDKSETRQMTNVLTTAEYVALQDKYADKTNGRQDKNPTL